jgi:hypothetical protein
MQMVVSDRRPRTKYGYKQGPKCLLFNTPISPDIMPSESMLPTTKYYGQYYLLPHLHRVPSTTSTTSHSDNDSREPRSWGDRSIGQKTTSVACSLPVPILFGPELLRRVHIASMMKHGSILIASLQIASGQDGHQHSGHFRS